MQLDIHFTAMAHIVVSFTNLPGSSAGMTDYQPQWIEFLWVRWYEHVETVSAGWAACKLDCVHFPPVAEEGSFGFIDLADVLRCYTLTVEAYPCALETHQIGLCTM